MPIDGNGQRWACHSCIRGHRSRDCRHFDRWMIAVKRPGRPNNCPHRGKDVCDCATSRMVIMVAIPRTKACECKDPSDTKRRECTCANCSCVYETRVILDDLPKAAKMPVTSCLSSSAALPLSIQGTESDDNILYPPSALPLSAQSPERFDRITGSEDFVPKSETQPHLSPPADSFSAITPAEQGYNCEAPDFTGDIVLMDGRKMQDIDIPSQHQCSCGPGCLCSGCAAHPFNVTSLREIKEGYQALKMDHYDEALLQPEQWQEPLYSGGWTEESSNIKNDDYFVYEMSALESQPWTPIPEQYPDPP